MNDPDEAGSSGRERPPRALVAGIERAAQRPAA